MRRSVRDMCDRFRAMLAERSLSTGRSAGAGPWLLTIAVVLSVRSSIRSRNHMCIGPAAKVG